jgi:hypothetical protein
MYGTYTQIIYNELSLMIKTTFFASVFHDNYSTWFLINMKVMKKVQILLIYTLFKK